MHINKYISGSVVPSIHWAQFVSMCITFRYHVGSTHIRALNRICLRAWCTCTLRCLPSVVRSTPFLLSFSTVLHIFRIRIELINEAFSAGTPLWAGLNIQYWVQSKFGWCKLVAIENENVVLSMPYTNNTFCMGYFTNSSFQWAYKMLSYTVHQTSLWFSLFLVFKCIELEIGLNRMRW